MSNSDFPPHIAKKLDAIDAEMEQIRIRYVGELTGDELAEFNRAVAHSYGRLRGGAAPKPQKSESETLSVYVRTNPDHLSDHDLLAIQLPVCIWQLIREYLADEDSFVDDPLPEDDQLLSDADLKVDDELTRHGWSL